MDQEECSVGDAASPPTDGKSTPASALEVVVQQDLLSPHRVVACCPFPKTGGDIGRSVWLAGRPSAHTFPFRWMVGPDWPCMCYTYALITIPSVLFLWKVALAVHVVVFGLSLALLVTTLVTFSFTACTDPGIIPKRDEPPPQPAQGSGLVLCVHCNVYRDRLAAHCFECDVCVLELDHHCPWTGKCIGQRNLSYFRAFLFLIGLLFTWTLFVTAVFAYVTK